MEALDLALLGGGLAVVAEKVVEKTDVELERDMLGVSVLASRSAGGER